MRTAAPYLSFWFMASFGPHVDWDDDDDQMMIYLPNICHDRGSNLAPQAIATILLLRCYLAVVGGI